MHPKFLGWAVILIVGAGIAAGIGEALRGGGSVTFRLIVGFCLALYAWLFSAFLYAQVPPWVVKKIRFAWLKFWRGIWWGGE